MIRVLLELEPPLSFAQSYQFPRRMLTFEYLQWLQKSYHKR